MAVMTSGQCFPLFTACKPLVLVERRLDTGLIGYRRLLFLNVSRRSGACDQRRDAVRFYRVTGDCLTDAQGGERVRFVDGNRLSSPWVSSSLGLDWDDTTSAQPTFRRHLLARKSLICGRRLYTSQGVCQSLREHIGGQTQSAT